MNDESLHSSGSTAHPEDLLHYTLTARYMSEHLLFYSEATVTTEALGLLICKSPVIK